MKRISCLLLSLMLLACLSGCGKEKEKTDTASVDLEYYASLGQIPECNYKLGDSIDSLEAALSSEQESASAAGEEYVYTVTEGEKTVCINNGSFLYYYEKDKKENGISYIAALDTAYGFENGTSVLDVKKALAGYEYTEENADSDNTFFHYGISNGSVMKYTFGNTVVMLVFQDDGFSAAVIYNTEHWTV